METLCIKIDAIKIEITPYRKEVEYYNRRPIKYEHVNNLIDDLYRRDFTINSICMDKDGNIVDLLNGRNDLNNKIIRCIGNSNDRIVEDPLRILRALRFSAYLNFDIDNELMKSIYDNKELLRELSYERKYLEIDKIIDLKRLDILEGVSEYLDIDLSNIKYYNSKILVWMNIDYLNKYCISKKDRNIIDSVNKLNSEGLNNYSIYKYGLYISSLVGELNNIDVSNIYNSLPIKCRKDINISSYDIIDIIEDIKGVENVYIKIEKAIVNNDINNVYSEIVDYIIKNI